jgi:hypothetical protein
MKNKILELKQKGYSYQMIQRELGCSKSTISYHLGEGQKLKTIERTKKQRILYPWLHKSEKFLKELPLAPTSRVGQAAGQVEEVLGADGRMYKVPRTTLLNQPTGQGVGQTTPQGGPTGAASRISPAQEAINRAASDRYNEFTKTSLESALTVGDRTRSAEYLYNAAEQLDPNKATEFLSGAASYIRAIPGVGDKFDSFVGNVSMFNKTRSEGVLKGLESIKGNANAFEGAIVDKATTGVSDPKFVTKYISAIEIASAAKDEARQAFLDNYTGDPKGVFTAWQNSPDNPRIYNHPKVNQFLTEQIGSWQRGGSQGAPVLPSGFVAGRSKSTGAVQIKKPDGSIFVVGQ